MNRKAPNPDPVWEALADATRRRLVELLADEPQTTGWLVEQFNGLARTSVMKHLAVLEAAGIVRVRRAGRVRWNRLDAAAIRQVCVPWIGRHIRQMAGAMQRLKSAAEKLAADEKDLLRSSTLRKRQK